MTTLVPTSEPAGGSGEGQVSLCPVIRGLSWGLLCLLGAPGERPSCFSAPSPAPGRHRAGALRVHMCRERSRQRNNTEGSAEPTEGLAGRPMAASQPEARDKAASSSICNLRSYSMGCPSCYLAVGREPAETPLTFSALSKSTFTKR